MMLEGKLNGVRTLHEPRRKWTDDNKEWTNVKSDQIKSNQIKFVRHK